MRPMSAKKLIKILLANGFCLVRQKEATKFIAIKNQE